MSRAAPLLLPIALLLLGAGSASGGTFRAGTAAELDLLEARLRSTQFLTRATFGPTPAEVERLATRVLELGSPLAFEEWIDAQFELEPTLHHPLAKQMVLDDGFDLSSKEAYVERYPLYAWWHAAIAAPDQLRQRMAWALAQIFVVNRDHPKLRGPALDASGEPRYLGPVDYYDVLVRNAFGSYASTLHEVSVHPVMGLFLTHLRNRKGNPARGAFPDENFAREVMEVFSIGLVLLHPDGAVVTDETGVPIPTYDNEDVRELARVFTGFGYAGAESMWDNTENLHRPMQMFEEEHDKGAKRLIGGATLPAGQPGMSDVTAALDHLAAHPNVGPFIGRLLIQRLVRSNPSPSYVAAVAAAFAGGGGDWKRVLRATLLHPEALGSPPLERRDGALTVGAARSEDGRLMEPVLRYTAFVRALEPVSTHPTGRFLLTGLPAPVRQQVYRAPDVFNFYRHDYAPAGLGRPHPADVAGSGGPAARGDSQITRLVAPEFQIETPAATIALYNRLREDVRLGRIPLAGNDASGPIGFPILLRFDEIDALAADPQRLLEHLDLRFCRGSLADSTRATIAQAIGWTPGPATAKARAAVLAVLVAPECVIHE